MNEPEQHPSDSRIGLAFCEYFRKVDGGEHVDVATFLETHADIADELQTCLEAANMIQRMAGPTVAEHSQIVSSQDTSKPAGIEETIAAADGSDAAKTISASGDSLPKVFGR